MISWRVISFRGLETSDRVLRDRRHRDRLPRGRRLTLGVVVAEARADAGTGPAWMVEAERFLPIIRNTGQKRAAARAEALASTCTGICLSLRIADQRAREVAEPKRRHAAGTDNRPAFPPCGRA